MIEFRNLKFESDLGLVVYVDIWNTFYMKCTLRTCYVRSIFAICARDQTRKCKMLKHL